jgi:hypothetical protein
MRTALGQFFNPTNTVFSALLAALVLTIVCGLAWQTGTPIVEEQVETWNEIVVRGEHTRRVENPDRASASSGFIPISSGSPGQKYSEIGRDVGEKSRRVTFGNLPTWMWQVIPALLLLLSLWPLLAAAQAKRWVLGCMYVGLIVVVGWHSYDAFWRHFPDSLLARSDWDFTAVGVWAIFLMLALIPAEALKPVVDGQRVAAWLLCACGLAMAASIAAWGGSIENVSENRTEYVAFRLHDGEDADKPRQFTAAEIDTATVPESRKAERPPWRYSGGGGGGSGTSKSSTSLAAVAFTLLFVLMIGVGLCLWPYRILACKGYPRPAMALTCIMMVVGTGFWLLDIKLLSVNAWQIQVDPTVLIGALVIAWLIPNSPARPGNVSQQEWRRLAGGD